MLGTSSEYTTNTVYLYDYTSSASYMIVDSYYYLFYSRYRYLRFKISQPPNTYFDSDIYIVSIYKYIYICYIHIILYIIVRVRVHVHVHTIILFLGSPDARDSSTSRERFFLLLPAHY